MMEAISHGVWQGHIGRVWVISVGGWRLVGLCWTLLERLQRTPTAVGGSDRNMTRGTVGEGVTQPKHTEE